MALLDQQAQEQVATVASVAAKTSTAALGGQFLFGYTINEFAALVGMTIAIIQFVYWTYEKIQKFKARKEAAAYGCEV